jgi:nucleoside-diphosphate-sugar epimerase
VAALPGEFDWIVNTVSSTRGGSADYEQVYLQGTRHLIERFGGTALRKYVHTGSTSVYGQTDGVEVDETSSTEPASATSRILVEVEQLLVESSDQCGFPAVLLRVAGIYGPGRGHLFLKYLRGEARLDGTGERLINMIHRDDLVEIIIGALERGRTGQVYNVADDEPVSQRVFFEWLSRELNKPMPPAATEEERTHRKRGLTQKKVSNRKLREEIGLSLRYPTFREGYQAEIRRLRAQSAID